MESLSIAFLRQELRYFKLKYAFAQVRNYSLGPVTGLSFRDQQVFGVKSSICSLEMENKHQYLKYMEQVLLKKELELGQMEGSLLNQKKALELQEAQCKIVTPMSLAHHSEALTKKIKIFKQVMLKYVTQCPQLALDNDFQDLIDGLQLIEQTCKHSYEQIKEQLLKNHQEMAAQRQMLASKLSKLQELQSYEKYLTQLQRILQQKEFQLVSREQELKTIESSLKSSARKPILPCQPNLPQYETFQEENGAKIQSEASVRRRTKIFEPKVTVYEPSNHKQSSKIMQQTSTQHNIQPITPDSYNTLDSETLPSQKDYSSFGVQTSERDPRISLAKQINSQAVYIKFLKLWFRFSAKKTKNIQHSALMHLYHWRLNLIFEEGLKKSLTEVLWWPRKLQLSENLPFQNYGQLSLKKQKYLEHFFELELKKFQRKKVLTSLTSILKNRNRKERLVFLLYFRKYREQSTLAGLLTMIKSECTSGTYALREVTTQHSQNTNNTNLALSQNNKESRLIQSSSGFLDDPLKLSTAKSKTSRKALLQSSQIKQKGKEANIDMSKLREYIKNQEETEVKLAMECAKTKAAFRVANVLKVRVWNLQQKFMVNLIRWDENTRLQEVLQAVNSYQFKWQLFMAKARLALTSNTNKVAHLQQLLSFLRADK